MNKDSTLPDEECPWSGRYVRFLSIVVDRGWPSNGVDVRAQEKDIYEDISDLKSNTVCPSVRHGSQGRKRFTKESAICRLRTSDVFPHVIGPPKPCLGI